MARPREITSTSTDYLRRFAAQTAAIGTAGQLRLRRAHVGIIGAGGVGSTVCLALAGVGVGRITVIDAQNVTPDNFNRFAFASDKDLGSPKVELLGRTLKERAHLQFEGIARSCAARRAMASLRHSDVIISAANTVAARIRVAKFTRRYRIRHVFAGVDDARQTMGGTVGVWIPERGDLACEACYLSGQAAAGGESLLTTPVTVIGALAAHLVVGLLISSSHQETIRSGNLMTVDLGRWQMGSVLVRRHPRCLVCARRVRSE